MQSVVDPGTVTRILRLQPLYDNEVKGKTLRYSSRVEPPKITEFNGTLSMSFYFYFTHRSYKN
jgi:hypothetical protein